MKRVYKRVVVIYFLVCFPFSIALGCIYNVRDVGFTDIGSTPYRLYCYIREDMPGNLTATLRQISYAASIDSNVEVEMINVDQQKASPDHIVPSPAMKYLEFWDLQSFPAAILVSPEGRSLVLPIPVPGKLFTGHSSSLLKEKLWFALESVVISPKRKEFLASTARAYCVVLLIQGKNAAENKKAQATVTNAIEEISRMMNQMTKSIATPPRLIVVSPELFSQERILLWSLGVNENELDVPYVAVLYGRGRHIEPLFKGEGITENGVFNILSVIGESCECGIDKEWVMGTMVPLRWGEKVQSEVAKALGFDVESPMVKTEISQILSLGPSLGTDKSPESKLASYSETTVEFDSGPKIAAVSPAKLRQLISRRPDVSDKRHPYRMALLIVGGMVLLILIGGISIVLRAQFAKRG